MTQRIEDVRKRAQRSCSSADVLLDGHFDYGNGYHGRIYVNPHMLFCYPVDHLAAGAGHARHPALRPHRHRCRPSSDRPRAARCSRIRWPGCSTAGAASSIRPACSRRCTSTPRKACGCARPIAPCSPAGSVLHCRRRAQHGQDAEPLRGTGAEGWRRGAGTVQIYDRMAAIVTLDVPNVALIEYGARDIYTSTTCPLCAAGVPLTSF